MDMNSSNFNSKLFFLVQSALLLFAQSAYSQNGTEPEDNKSCVVSVGNSNAPLAADGSYTVFNIPGDLGAVRARATCSDGSVGESEVGFTSLVQDAVIPLGPIEFGEMSAVPIAASLTAPSKYLNSNESTQMQVLAIGLDGSSRDVTARSEGTVYSASNDLIGSIDDNGLVSITANFDTASSARLVASAITEGSVSSTFSFFVGPRGSLTGRVFQADGTTPVEGAVVGVQRLQPVESTGAVLTDSNGQFLINDVNAGLFRITAIDPDNGDQSIAYATLQLEGEVVNVDLTLKGQGQVNVSVKDGADQLVSDAIVTITSFGPNLVVKTASTNAAGTVSFDQMPADDFAVSTRDPNTGLFGSAVGSLAVGQTADIGIQLQQTGDIEGLVFDIDGATPLAGVQVRIASRQKGIISQAISATDGSFSFDTLPQADGPFLLDAFVDGRLRGRVPNIVFNAGDTTLNRDIVLNSVGVVRGKVRDVSGNFYANAEVTMQSLSGESLSFSAFTDELGNFVLPAVPVGEFEISAVTQTGEFGRSTGELLADGDSINLDVVLVSNTLVGTVYERDGVTPVLAGTTVYLAEKSEGEFYSYSGSGIANVTQTDAAGRYGFAVTEPGDFYVQAEDGLNRGRSRAILVNLDPSQPFETDVKFLAKGTVYGQVVDANGVAQAGVEVKIYSEGAFEATRMVSTDVAGNYSLDGVFAGNLVVLANNPVNDESAVRYERLDAEGEQVEINLVLAASGSVQGQVLNHDGQVIDTAIKLTVLSGRTPFAEFNLSDGQSYSVSGIPVGDITVTAEELETGNKGISSSRINFQNEVKYLDVTLIGQAAVTAELVDIDGNPVENAVVKVSNETPFRVSQTLESDANGLVFFETVNAGDYQITANKDLDFGALQGAASGTLLPDQDIALQIVMEAIPVGAIRGTLFESDGVTPAQAGWVVKMLPEPFEDAYVTTTDANGEYQFNQVNAGTYNIAVMEFYDLDPPACPSQDRNRAGANGVQLVSQDEVVIADMLLIGAGEVFGVVETPDGQPASGIDISLTNADPFFGGNVTCNRLTTFDTVTNSLGEYRLVDIPPGNFTMLAENAAGTLRAEASGRVRFNEDEVELNITLVDNVITMPYDFYDANGFLYDISGDGSITTGTRSVYAATAPDTGAMKLSIITNGVPVPFFNGDGTIGELSTDGQEVTLDDITASGLFVSRKIRTPRSGYFSRYLEVLSNPTDEPIEVGVRIESHHRPSSSNPRVVDTTDGDQILSILSPTNPDRWVVVDDQNDTDPFETNSIAASGHVFDGADANEGVDVAEYALIGQTGKLTYQWDQIVVPPGEEVILMHFVLGQIKRGGARAAATRLVNLPPEAIDDLATDVKAKIMNFSVPEFSNTESLPNLDAGRITGRVLSGNGANVIPDADVKFVSLHPLFKRIRNLRTNELGEFVYESTLDGTVSNYVIPVFGYNMSASYARSGAASAITPGEFEDGTVETIQDLIFIGTGDVKGNVLRHNGAAVSDAEVKLCNTATADECRRTDSPDNYSSSEADGSYELLANTPRDYFLYALKTHPQRPVRNLGRKIRGNGAVTVTSTDVVVADIIMEETGSISGVVKSAQGVTVSEALVELYIEENGNFYIARETTTDTSGFYRFFDVPVGAFRINVIDSISNAQGDAFVDVVVDEETIQDINLLNTATLNVNVEFFRGVSANGASVSFYDGVTNQTAYTDSNGLAQFQVQSGTYQLEVRHPDSLRDGSPLTVFVDVEVTDTDEQVNVTAVLEPAGDVLGLIVRPDGTTLAGGFPYSVVQISGPAIQRISGETSDAGAYRSNGLPLGVYMITAYDAEQDRFADAEFEVTTDGEEVVVDMVLLDERIALPADLFDANQFKFDVQQDGSLLQGSSAYGDAGAELIINGEAFTGDTSARLQAGKRQFAITQPTTLSGLNVTRKVYVPRGAYFARYIEVFDNPTASDITIDVELSQTFGVGEVIQTSTGDISLSDADDWFIIDDTYDGDIKIFSAQMPSTGHVFAEPGHLFRPTSVTVAYTDLKPNVKQIWNQITIPAGQRKSIMHVEVQQINQLGAQTAVERLSQLPPEMLLDLTAADTASIINFDLPIDGVSEIEALPPLTGSINGVVYEGNESTLVPRTRVTIQSTHPLFSRVWGMQDNGTIDCRNYPGTVLSSLYSDINDATFAIQGQLTDTDSIAIPAGYEVSVTAQVAQGCYGDFAGHPFTNVPSRVVNFEPSGVQDVIFDTGVYTGSLVGSIDYSVTSGRMYLSIDNPGPPDYQYTGINSDGTYVYPGLLPGTYDLLFDTSHPDKYFQEDQLRGSKKSVILEVGEVLVSDINLQPTGTIQGSVVAFDGAQSENTRVTLIGDAENQEYDQCDNGCVTATLPINKGKRTVSRRVFTDSLGRYNLTTVPTGDYTLEVLDPVSGGLSTYPLTVQTNQVTTQNVILTAVGSAIVTVNDVNGNPVIDAVVYVDSEAEGGEQVAGRTDFNGVFEVANIPLGDYQIRVTDPRSPNIKFFDLYASGNISASGQNNSHEVNLLVSSNIDLTVVDSDNGGLFVNGADITISDNRGQRSVGNTDVNGELLIQHIPLGSFSITANATVNGIEKQETIFAQIESSDNNSTIPLDLDLKSTLVDLPLHIKDANNERYDLTTDGDVQRGTALYIEGELFEAESSIISQLDGRQFEMDSNNVYSGLNVSRKAFVPLNGYFIRYQEIIENPNAFDVTVDISVQSTVVDGVVESTSSGDELISNSGVDRDLWFVSSDRSTNHYGVLASDGTVTSLIPALNHQNINNFTAKTSGTWSEITIPANSTVQVLHFFVQQNGVESATTSLERLLTIPPESLVGMVTTDVNEIINFTLPLDLISSVEALPELNGQISGHVYEGDGLDPVRYVDVSISHDNLLYPNTIESYSSNDLVTDINGFYRIVGSLSADGNSYPIPIGSEYTITGERSSSSDAVVVVDFPIDQTSIEVDLLFSTGSIEGTLLGAYPDIGDEYVRIKATQNGVTRYNSQLNPDNTFEFIGMEAGVYDLVAQLGELDSLLLANVGNVSVVTGSVTQQDLVFDPNGAVTGQVTSSTGVQLPNQEVVITQQGTDFYRETLTNSTGDYVLSALPVGEYDVTAISSQTGAGVTAHVVVEANQLTQQDFTLIGVGTVTITVKDPSGNLIDDVYVSLTSDAINGSTELGYTDEFGQLVAEIPVGTYTLNSRRPETNQPGSVNGVVNFEGETSSIDLVLPAVASLQFNVLNGSLSNAPIGSATIRLQDPDVNGSSGRKTGFSDANGIVLFENLKQITYEVSVEFLDNHETEFLYTILPSMDGQTTVKDVVYNPDNHAVNSLQYFEEQLLNQVEVSSGDVLSINARSVAGSNGSACAMQLAVYDPNGLLLVESNFTGSNMSSTLGDVRAIPILIDGSYTISSHFRYSWCTTGDYFISAYVYGESFELGEFSTGGSVAGHVYEADGVTPIAGELVRIQTQDAIPGLDTRVLTDAMGAYEFSGVPLGEFKVTYLPRVDSQQTGTISQIGEQVNIDLIVSSLTTFNINVLNADLTPIDRSARLDIRIPGQSRVRPYTNSTGSYNYNYTGSEVASIAVVSPYDSQVSALQLVEAVGGPIEVNLILDQTSVSGTVFEYDGITVVPNSRVEARYAHNNGYFGQTSTNAQGQYTFDNLPVDVSLILSAEDPVNGVEVNAGVDTVQDVITQLDFLLIGKGTVFGTISGLGDIPVSGLNVSSNYDSTSTDINGYYELEHMPVGRSLTVYYDDYRSYASLYGEGNIELINPNEAGRLDMFVSGSVVSVTLTAADGSSVGDQCRLSLQVEYGNENGDTYRGDEQSCDESFNVVGIPDGQQIEFSIRDNTSNSTLYANSWYLDFDQLIQDSQLLSVLTGEVSYFDGSAVFDASLSSGIYGTNSDSFGMYRMLGVKQGDFTVSAYDPASGLRGQAAATLINEAIPQILDIQLQASGEITGVVTDPNGVPLINVRVYAENTLLDFDTNDNTDANGLYELPYVALGKINLSVADTNTQNVTTANTELTFDGENQAVDLQFIDTGTVNVDLSSSIGSVESGCIELKHTHSYAAYDEVSYLEQDTDFALFDSVAPGPVLIRGMSGSCYSSGEAALLEADVISSGNSNQSIQIGNALSLSTNLNEGGTNFRINVSNTGAVTPENNSSNGSYNNRPFKFPNLELNVNGRTLNEQRAVFDEVDNQQVVVGPTSTDFISFERQIYSGINGDFARLADKVTNIGLAPIQVKVQLSGAYANLEVDYNEGGNSAPNVLLTTDPANNGNKYAIHQYDGIESSDPAVTAYVFADDFIPSTVATDFMTARSEFSWSWTQTIQPGETAIFLSFLVYSEPDDLSTVNSIINELIDGSKTDMFDGMSIEDMSDVVNFQVP